MKQHSTSWKEFEAKLINAENDPPTELPDIQKGATARDIKIPRIAKAPLGPSAQSRIITATTRSSNSYTKVTSSGTSSTPRGGPVYNISPRNQDHTQRISPRIPRSDRSFSPMESPRNARLRGNSSEEVMRRGSKRALSAGPQRNLLTDRSRSRSNPRSNLATHDYTSQYQVEGISQFHLKKIYAGKCKDLGIQVFQGQQERFFEYCSKHLVDRRFDMRDSGLGSEAVKGIGEALSITDAFANINVSRNPLGDAGARVIAKSLAKNNALVHLDMGSNDLSDEGLTSILGMAAQHESLISLNLSSHEGLFRNRFLHKSPKVLGRTLQLNKQLCILNIAGTSLGKNGCMKMLKGLTGNQTLISLNLRQNDLGGEVLENLFSTLVSTKVRDLNLSENGIGEIGCKNFDKMIKGDFGSGLPLEKLTLAKNGINARGTEYLWNAMSLNRSIKHLNVEKNEFGPLGMYGFAKFLSQNQGLLSLNMNNCEIKTDGCKQLEDGLSCNKNLKKLYFSHNYILSRGAQYISKALAENKWLELIDLSSNRIGDDGGSALANSLKTNKILSSIDLSDNNLSDESGYQFAEVSCKHTAMHKINLKSNPINYKYIQQIRLSINSNISSTKKKQTPRILTQIKQLKQRSNSIDEVKTEINKQIENRKDIEDKLEPAKATLEEATKKYEVKTEEVKQNTALYREKFEEAAAALLKTKEDLRIVEMTQVKAKREKVAEIHDVAKEIKVLQKEKTELRQNYNMLRVQREQEKFVVDCNYQDVKRNKDMAVMTFEGFDKQIQAIKLQLYGPPIEELEKEEAKDKPVVKSRKVKKGKKCKKGVWKSGKNK